MPADSPKLDNSANERVLVTRSPRNGPAEQIDRSRNRLLRAGGILLLWAALLAAYWPALSGQFIWDDDAHLTRPELQSTQGLYRIWFEIGATQQYYPLLHSTFWVEHQLWGDSPIGYHIANLFWHAIAASLVYVILRKLAVPGALLAASVWALHPVQVETVAWITEHKNTLSAMFYLSALWVYLRFDETRRWSIYCLALVLFISALLTKTITATLPAALLVIFWWERKNLEWRRDVLPLVPWFAIGTVAGLFTAWVERRMIGAEGEAFDFSVMERILLACRVPWFYLGKLFWPQNLTFFYRRWDVDVADWRQWMYVLATAGTTVVLWRQSRRYRGPLAGWLFFVGTLFPVLGFLNVYPFVFSFVADHFQYLAGLGIIVVASSAVALTFLRLPPATSWAGIALAMVLVTVLATCTRAQSEMYRDVETLYRTTIERNPTSWLALNNLGIELSRTGRISEAIERYEQSLALKPNYVNAHNNLGLALFSTGRTPEAIEQFRETLRIDKDDVAAHYNLANALVRTGQLDEATEHYRETLRLKPNLAQAHSNFAAALVQQGRPKEAIDQYQLAMQLGTRDATLRNDLGVAFANAGNLLEAIENYEEALRQRSDYPEAHNNLANALSAKGDPDKAILHYKTALQLKPNYPEAHNNFGNILLQTGKSAEAIEQYQEALRLQPDYAEAANNLGVSLASAGRLGDAIEPLRHSLSLQPNNMDWYLNLATVYLRLHRDEEATAVARKALDLAKAQGRTAIAEKIETWLSSNPQIHSGDSQEAVRPQ